MLSPFMHNAIETKTTSYGVNFHPTVLSTTVDVEIKNDPTCRQRNLSSTTAQTHWPHFQQKNYCNTFKITHVAWYLWPKFVCFSLGNHTKPLESWIICQIHSTDNWQFYFIVKFHWSCSLYMMCIMYNCGIAFKLISWY